MIRDELFSVERLEQHAGSLATAQAVTSRPRAGHDIAGRLHECGRVLLEAYRGVEQAVRDDRAITPADEWLLDNFHVAEEQIRHIRADLPRGFYRGLPKLAGGPLQGYPRVFGLAWALIAHTDSRCERETLVRFVTAYQRVQPLTIGELWALPITLRIILVENLRRCAERISAAREARVEADRLADHLLGTGGRPPAPPEAALRRFNAIPLPTAFIERLLQRLRDQDPRVTPALVWVEGRLALERTTVDELIRGEHQRQGGMTVTVRNVITSMRLIATLDWVEIFESVSLVDAALRAGSQFAAMDFPTRDRYRHAIEQLARASGRDELEVTRRALAAAQAVETSAGLDDDSGRRQDPGYYLIANGRRDFEQSIGYRVTASERGARAITRAGIAGYVVAVAFLTVVLSAVPLLGLSALGITGWPLLLLAVLSLAAASDLAVALANRAITHDLSPNTLPALDLHGGVPPELRTLIVVPTLLTTRRAIDRTIERLEVHHLASQDGDLRFALLSDWMDAATRAAPGDDDLLAAAASGIARLNRRYGAAAGGPRFLLLHRQRTWNAGQGAWIGWERKRGKLHELNRWLRDGADTIFVPIAGAAPVAPPGVRYVITLDADTRLPRGTAKRLVGKMAHPLNRPRLDPIGGRVVEGYAVLQPRVTPLLPSHQDGSVFQRVFTTPSGLDPYAFAVSDLYQDLFGEGSYIGKGIYDVDVFETALRQRIPESTLLSHDLLEGIFARAGLVSDIEVIEAYPARYDLAAARQHRWARGDWQLLPWIIGGRGSAIPLIGRWKMLDNLRRTMSAPGTFLALLTGWTLPRPAAALWTASIIATIAIPPLVAALGGIIPARRGLSWRRHWHTVGSDLTLAFAQIALVLTLVAHQAWLMSDAIARTLFRLWVGHRRLLDWRTAEQSNSCGPLDLGRTYRWMSGGLALTAGAAAVAGSAQPESWPVAAPFVIAWALSPGIMHWVSRPSIEGPDAAVPSATDASLLRLTARRSWRFFETFVTPEEHALPPDNFQEDPTPVVAHRTSPTNIGLYLLSVIAARDFGWLGTLETVERLEATLASLNRLERFRGHFYNWYGTRDLRPLEPKFISAVDSGNLAGHLITLEAACRQMSVAPVLGAEALAGIDDGVRMTGESLRHLSDSRRTRTVTRRHLDTALDALSSAVAASRGRDVRSGLPDLLEPATTLLDIARTLSAERADSATADVLACAAAALASIRSHQRDFAGTVLPRGAVPEPFVQPVAAFAVVTDPARSHRLATVNAPPIATVPGGEGSPAAVPSLETRLAAIVALARGLFDAMDFGLLLDTDRQLLSIGYRVADGALDPSCYDLLASEARLASFLAIAKGDAPTRHWFHLGRTLTPVHNGGALFSWSGSMFEYLMPNLILQSPPGSLLDQTSRIVVARQIEYGAERGLPWGVSESAYNARDLERTYQYSSFGVPDLGLKRGLGDEAVVAPYATALAAMIAPHAAVRNFARLAGAGGRGPYGWYEALDYTPARLPEGHTLAVVRAYMAHHQGMTLVALDNALHAGIMRARFHTEPIVQAAEPLLQERMPRDVEAAHLRRDEGPPATQVREMVPPTARYFSTAQQPVVHTQLLSNGRYTVMMTVAGSGYSRWGDLAVTRWRDDPTCDNWGAYIFLRDADRGTVWSVGYQPTAAEPDRYEATFFEDRIEIVRRDGTMTTRLDVTVSPEDDAEARRVTMTNGGRRSRVIDVTSYAELVLATDAADRAHPAFSKLFVQTEFIAEIGAVLATRRRRSPDEPPVWAAHLTVVEGAVVGALQFESDRARFLGRGRGVRQPESVIDGRPLSNTSGSVLDPIFSLRRRIHLAPGATAHVTFWTIVASSRLELLDLIDKHRDSASFDRAATLAWTLAQVQLFHIGIGADDASLFQRLAGHVLYSNPALRPSSAVLTRSQGGPAWLWEHGISGDVPIVVCRIDDVDDLPIVRQLLQAHAYWRMKQLAVDLVILNEHAATYTRDLQTALEAMVRASQSQQTIGAAATRGGVFVLRADLVSVEAHRLLLDVARAVLLSRGGSLFDQVRRLDHTGSALSRPSAHVAANSPPAAAASPAAGHLEFFNGLGGFRDGGREYVTVLGQGQWTPTPWINVIANASFGFHVSVDGSGFTWAINSQQHALSPWSNDAVSDRPGEVFYVRDDEDGTLWTPTALPIREAEFPYIAIHGHGYSRFEHAAHGVSLTLLQFVPDDDPIKISRLSISNQSGRTRRLAITAYVEWVLGASREGSAPYVSTEIDPGTGAMLARNHWSMEFSDRVAFADCRNRQQSWTGDRREFLGRDGDLESPAALAGGQPLSNRVGGGLDPCGALQTSIELAPGEATEIVFLLGEAADRAAALSLIARYRAADLDAVFSAVTGAWKDRLGRVQVKTPDRAMDLMLNGWLLYQTLACRVWARAGFYQASGAYGFRDQLQDVLSLGVSMPQLARAHLLRAAARQFVDGDVQHWWLPPSGRGVRTRISDDRVWLPYVVAQYVETSGDAGVLDDMVPFLDGPPLQADEQESYFLPSASREQGTVFEHCARALDTSLPVGSHGLPLMGTGDWNDGMNRVGSGGRGESIWLGWFLHATLMAFAPLADRRGEHARGDAWRQHAAALGQALEKDGWDGGWYRRAFFDDGTVLGGSANAECRIDSVAQSWAVLSEAADRGRAAMAMAAVDQQLIRRDDRLALIFTPPFEHPAADPGYIQGYPAGIRENGGQYTHAAVWSVIAFAMLGDGDKAAALFDLLNPINHGSTRADISQYQVEPYVACADVYAEPQHLGRGGWTWYTGAAGWMYRAGLESILGFRLRGTALVIDPCVPRSWTGFELTFQYHSARYEITVENPDGVSRGVRRIVIDGTVRPTAEPSFDLCDDAAVHHVQVVLG
ncbi:MAG: glucoamylase family protein [Acidobacteriota bacterium]